MAEPSITQRRYAYAVERGSKWPGIFSMAPTWMVVRDPETGEIDPRYHSPADIAYIKRINGEAA